jgi:hypothetical protein
MKLGVILWGVIVAAFWGGSLTAAACSKTEPFFTIERNKNGNVVHYDACVAASNNVLSSEPVAVYRVLENGEKEELNVLERKYAYGIESQKDLGNGNAEIVLPALKDRRMTIEKIDGAYRVLASIDGKESVLERVYVQSKDRFWGLPKVVYIDILGRSLQDNSPVEERIVPKG